MELGFNRQNVKNILWHLVVVAGSAVALELLNMASSAHLDPKTLGVLAVVSPLVKTAIESVRKA